MQIDKSKIKWCARQSKGLQLIEAKPHLSDAYMKEADETLENVFSATGKWKLITAYYACYNALYSLLMKCGIKCEIHDCTLELMELFGFEALDINYIRELKEGRIQAQYYLQSLILEDEQKVKKFVLRCKTILADLDSEKIESIRKKIKNIMDN